MQKNIVLNNIKYIEVHIVYLYLNTSKTSILTPSYNSFHPVLYFILFKGDVLADPLEAVGVFFASCIRGNCAKIG